jgi:phasin
MMRKAMDQQQSSSQYRPSGARGSNGQMDFEIPDSVREVVGKSVDQAHQAYSRFLDAARQANEMACKSTDAVTSGLRDLHEKTVKYAESNLQSYFDLAQRLVRAKDFKEALDIQNAFAHRQMETFAHQAQDWTRLMAESAQSAQRTVQSATESAISAAQKTTQAPSQPAQWPASPGSAARY